MRGSEVIDWLKIRVSVKMAGKCLSLVLVWLNEKDWFNLSLLKFDSFTRKFDKLSGWFWEEEGSAFVNSFPSLQKRPSLRSLIRKMKLNTRFTVHSVSTSKVSSSSFIQKSNLTRSPLPKCRCLNSPVSRLFSSTSTIWASKRSLDDLPDKVDVKTGPLGRWEETSEDYLPNVRGFCSLQSIFRNWPFLAVFESRHDLTDWLRWSPLESRIRSRLEWEALSGEFSIILLFVFRSLCWNPDPPFSFLITDPFHSNTTCSQRQSLAWMGLTSTECSPYQKERRQACSGSYEQHHRVSTLQQSSCVLWKTFSFHWSLRWRSWEPQNDDLVAREWFWWLNLSFSIPCFFCHALFRLCRHIREEYPQINIIVEQDTLDELSGKFQDLIAVESGTCCQPRISSHHSIQKVPLKYQPSHNS